MTGFRKYHLLTLIVLLSVGSLCLYGLTSSVVKKGGGSSINLSRKGLTEIPEYVFDKKDLTVLKLYGNHIDSISERIGELENLEKLYLGRNDLKTLPESIGKLKKLKVLSLMYNEIDQLPESIGELESLEQLWLNQNQLEGLPTSLGNLKKLEVLRVNFNQLESVPTEIGDCEKLKFIHLNRNNLDSLPTSMGNLRNLKEIYLSGAGPLLQVPESMCDLRFLELIEIDGTIALPPCMYVLQANRLHILIRY